MKTDHIPTQITAPLPIRSESGESRVSEDTLSAMSDTTELNTAAGPGLQVGHRRKYLVYTELLAYATDCFIRLITAAV